ncbi:MAG: transglycosylase domain-containing protein [Fimbriimonas sp.]|nr:transglycosylase domain-containing protein [Fimbriimonas sp.]
MKRLKISAVLFTFLAAGAVIGAFAFLRSSMETVKPLVMNMGEKIQTFNSKPSQIFSTDGKLLYEVMPIYRESISLSDVPDMVQKAFLAAEDKRFLTHSGVDPMGLGRAMFKLVRAGEAQGGGSTITMQLAKMLFSASEKSMQRKIQDISIALEMEKEYTKDFILETYLNQAFYGEQAYGIAAAAEVYFGKKPSELTLAEAAMLARCVRLPSTQNPVKNYQKADQNKIVVLNTMLEEKWITPAEYNEARDSQPKIVKRRGMGNGRIYRAPYFTAMVLQDLKKRGVDISGGGYVVSTTLDSSLQKETEAAVDQHIRWNRGRGVNAGAFLAIDAEGRIVADVGGSDYKRNQYSRTSQSQMQPGSAFKTFVYAEALKEGILSEFDSVSNEKLKLPGKTAKEPYIPRNSHGGWGGSYSLRSAFANSMNVPAVRTFVSMGVKHATELIQEDFGFITKLQPYAPLALGATDVRMTEMAEAYSVIMLDGRRVEPYRITEVQGPDGSVVFTGSPSYVTTRLGPDVCHAMDRLLQAVVQDGTGYKAASMPEARGKTGTTNGGKSVWFCGYAKGIVGICWAGNEYFDKRRNRWLLREMAESFGGDVCAPMWAQAMKVVAAKYGSDVKPDFLPREAEETNAERRARRRREQEEEEQNQNPDQVTPDLRGDDTTEPAQPDINKPKSNPDDPTENPPTQNNDEPPVRDDSNPVEKPKPEKKPPKKPETKEEDVEVEVCADSGQLAGSYCPETVVRKFSKGKRPRGKCRVHKVPSEGGG